MAHQHGGTRLTGDWGTVLKYMSGVALLDAEKLHRKIAAYGASSTVRRFETERDPEGKKWKESARAKMGGGQTLTDKGYLKSSIIDKATSAYAAWGTNRIYAGIHQFGGEIKAKGGGRLKFRLPDGSFRMVKKVKMPKRSFIGISKADAVRITKIAGRTITP